MSDTRLAQIHQELTQITPPSRALDPRPEDFAAAVNALADFAKGFLSGIPSGPAFATDPSPPQGLRETIPDSPSSLSAILDQYRAQVLDNGIHPTSGRFLGYIPGGGLPTAALGDFLAALTNKYSGVYYASPGAAEMENTTIRWLRDIVGYPAQAWGTLQSGGTLATLSAVVTARESRPPERWARGAIYATSEAHLAIAKSLHLAGMGHVTLRKVPVDESFRLSLPALTALIAEDRAQGLEPWIVFATAGTTNTGAVDPLEGIAALCRKEKLWFHIDAAYGGFFILCARTRALLSAMKEADSLVLDPHKGLFLPYGCGAVLVKDGNLLRRAMSFHSDYLPPPEVGEQRSPADYSPELTRHFRALRLWLSLKAHGLARFRAALDEKLLLAELAHLELAKQPTLEMGPPPQLSCVVFRVKGEDGRTTALNQKILARGRIFLSPTRLRGKLFLRLCVLCFRSHREELETALAEIRA
jgi:glutamate/tyrosine decarboxylase-like PLP-dependent enzyme